MRHKTLEFAAGRVIEVSCCQPGARDGCWMGYAIRFGGTWDSWVASPHDHHTMRKVAINTTKEAAIQAVVDNWHEG